MANLSKAAFVLCDIEGTTTSISFVKETLFPFALKNVEKFFEGSWEKDEVKAICEEFRKQSAKDVEDKLEGATAMANADATKEEQIAALVKIVQWQMGIDRKADPLKTLQGLIWADGYKDGSIKGHIYDDVAKAFDEWTKKDIKIYIYSSGSVQAQKLLFGHTTDGDLLPKLSGHFDTKIGLKGEKQSYLDIIKELNSKPEEIVFLTDIVKEATAAKESGIKAILVERPGNTPLTDEDKSDFPIVKSFAEILMDESSAAVATNGKRKSIEKEEVQEPPTKIIKTDNDEVDKAAIVTNDDTPKSIKASDADEKMEEDVDPKVVSAEPIAVADKAEKVVTDVVTAGKVSDNDKIATSNKEEEPMEVEEEVTEGLKSEIKDGAESEKEVIPAKNDDKTASNGEVVATKDDADNAKKSETKVEDEKEKPIATNDEKPDVSVVEKKTDAIAPIGEKQGKEETDAEKKNTDVDVNIDHELKNGDVSKTEKEVAKVEPVAKENGGEKKNIIGEDKNMIDEKEEKMVVNEVDAKENSIVPEVSVEKSVVKEMDTAENKKVEESSPMETEMPTITVTSETGEKMESDSIDIKPSVEADEKKAQISDVKELSNGDGGVEKSKEEKIEEVKDSEKTSKAEEKLDAPSPAAVSDSKEKETNVDDKIEIDGNDLNRVAALTTPLLEKTVKEDTTDNVSGFAVIAVTENDSDKINHIMVVVGDKTPLSPSPEVDGNIVVPVEAGEKQNGDSVTNGDASSNGGSPVKNGNDSDKENDIAAATDTQTTAADASTAGPASNKCDDKELSSATVTQNTTATSTVSATDALVKKCLDAKSPIAEVPPLEAES